MKERVYPSGLLVPGLHSYFVNDMGTWWRRLGSYSIQIIEPNTATPVGTSGDLAITGHAPRVIFGQRLAVAA